MTEKILQTCRPFPQNVHHRQFNQSMYVIYRLESYKQLPGKKSHRTPQSYVYRIALSMCKFIILIEFGELFAPLEDRFHCLFICLSRHDVIAQADAVCDCFRRSTFNIYILLKLKIEEETTAVYAWTI